ncbi:MAG TPA: hypothetical protein VK184_21830 [Nostocaceae cyanobacterium]|nr:hypothetical protein [Nostocaceae cyanobacterium]
MSEYQLVVRIPQAGNKEINYSIELNRLYESHPEDYFRQENHRLAISQTIEQASARKVSPTNLNSIISQWTVDIKSGLHRTVITLDLPPDASLLMQTVTNVIGNPTVLPAKQPTRKPLISPVSAVKPAKQPHVESVSPNTYIQPSNTAINNSEAEEKPAEKLQAPAPDVRTDTNKADF